MRNAQTISMLRELIAVSQDAEKGFRACAGHAHKPVIHNLLENCASTCTKNGHELRALLRQLGPAVARKSETGAIAHRGWNELRLTAEMDDASLLEECERCEAFTLEMYRNALDDHLPDFVRRIVLRQFIKIMRNQDRARARRGGDEPRLAQRANTGS